MTWLNLDRHTPLALAVLRVVSGLLFLAHGTQKVLSFPDGRFAGASIPLESLSGAAGFIEVIAGPMIILGLFTRPVAFLASGTMAFAYWLVHAPQSPFPVNNAGDASILFCFVFLFLSIAGPGRFSLDGVIDGRRPRAS